MGRQYEVKSVCLERLPRGSDMMRELQRLCRERGVKVGLVYAIGALERAAFSVYDQQKLRYVEHVHEEPTEILSAIGNISLKDGEPLCHVHLTLGTDHGSVLGGHLTQGCRVFACEVAILELLGEPLMRLPDASTGLPLWSLG